MFWSVLFFTAIGLTALAYIEGHLTCGFASYRVKYSGNIGNRGRGGTFGPKTVYLRRGQAFVVSYEVEITRGSLHFRVERGWYGINDGSIGAHTVRASGSGHFSAPIPADGWYRLSIHAHSDGAGCDLDYTATWSGQSAP